VIVRFKGNRKGYYHNRKGVDLRLGQYCLVEADRGRDLGQVIYLGPGRDRWWRDAVQQGVLALASERDLAVFPELRREELAAREVCQEKIREHGLDMELVGAERRWDRGKLTFYFLADQRVDFRALVRTLAGIFRTRIELRQIGVRDEAKLKGGVGLCGREFCCSSFLPGFDSVTLKMAKDQQLPLNPAKLSGPCGRLRCCLAFEHRDYRAALAGLPKPGSPVEWQGRPARARKLDPVKETVTIQLLDDEQEFLEVPASQLAFEKPALGPDREESAGKDSTDDRRRPRRRGGRRRRPRDAS
jgi:cell fate regulator YaaT (PSP1 superfamily)